MKKVLFILIGVALLGCTNNHKGASPLVKAGTMPAFENGYELGVSACYAAVYDGALYIAGGCNFPEKPAAEGGAKRYYNGIYKAVLGDTLVWEQVATLPAASAYGATVQAGSRWIIAGSMNSDGATSGVYCLDLEKGSEAVALPSLPCTIDNTAAAINGEKIYVVGGNADGKASNRVFMLDLAATEKGWQELPAMPSRARVQPVCAATVEALYVWGGFCPADSINDAVTHCDGARYIFAEQRWEKLPEVVIEGEEEPFSLSGGVATLCGDRIVAAGGVNKDIFTDAISGRYTLTSKEEYMHHPAEWYRFNSRLAAYDPQKGCWELISNDKAFARAGAAMTANGNDIIYIGGELKPGIRTPETIIFKQDK